MSGLPLNIDIQQILLHFLNFVILGTGLYILLYKPVLDFMQKREQTYKDMDEQAKATLAEAEQTKAEYEKRLEEADVEIAGKKAAAEQEIMNQRAEQLEETRAEADRILEKARANAGMEKEKMMEGARKEIATLAAEAAGKLVAGSSMEALDRFLDEAERGASDDQN